MKRFVSVRLACGALVAAATLSPTLAAPLAPIRTEGRAGAAVAVYSERTLTAAIAVDADGASLVQFTAKNRPYRRPEATTDFAASSSGGAVVLDVVLHGASGGELAQRVVVRGLCLDHPPETPAHIEGDRIQLHHEVVIVEFPDLVGIDRIDIAREATAGALAPATPLGTVDLSPERYTASGGTLAWESLAVAIGRKPAALTSELLTPGTVHWPAEYGDSEIYRTYGDTDYDRRINIVIVPDGYTYAEKATMITHATDLVAYFRGKTPYKEHDPFLNYILVFAYSNESGTDQCDCAIVKDTAMRTRFPLRNATCQHSDNRCLYYSTLNGGPSCDPVTSDVNISAAELRAPLRDQTLVMVNTTRYGGCGGYRAVYSAGNPSATEVGVHELGHSLAGLADEYVSYSGCSSVAGEVNTSTNGSTGAWPEWIPFLGAPREGAEYYSSCVYRPQAICDMRSLFQPFCAVCNQQWALTFFGHYNVTWTAPIEDSSPATPFATQVGAPILFNLKTRLGIFGVTNEYTWTLTGPGYPSPTVVSTTGPGYTRSFSLPGTYVLYAKLVADTNFVRPERYSVNVDEVAWSVTAQPIPEVSGTAVREMTLLKTGATVTLRFQDVGAAHYNVYVSKAPVTLPFAVSNPATGKKDCAVAGVTPVGGGMLQVAGYDPDAGIGGPSPILFILVTADNDSPTETSFGKTSSNVERTASSYCAR